MIEKKHKSDSVLRGKKIILAGGGSGGHITPLIAVGRLLRERGAELTLMGDFGGRRFRLLTDDLGVPLINIPAGKMRRYWSWENALSPVRILRGILAARRELRRLNPDMIFAKGGYGSFPVIVAAHHLGIPIVTHESDAVMGLANRWSTKYATRICVNFPIDTYPNELRHKLVWTGMPVGAQFFQLPQASGRKPLTLLVTGGSQGSEALNATLKLAKDVLQDYRILHITGPENFAAYADLAGPNYEVYGLVAPQQFSDLLGRTDIVIARASATIFSEIAAAGRPAILVPLPLPAAANNHQLLNARTWEKAGAATVLEQKDLTVENLAEAIGSVARPATWRTMAAAARRLAEPRAVDKITSEIEGILS